MIKWIKKLFSHVSHEEFIIKSETFIEPAIKSNFDIALKIVLGFEGGLSNHKHDKGGLTNYGVTQSTYDLWRKKNGLSVQSVKNIDDDEVRKIYRMYWDECGASELPIKSAIAVFDMAINSGSHRAKKIFGLASNDLEKFLKLREKYYHDIVSRNPLQKVFLKGWLNRLAHLKKQIGGIK